VPRQLQELSIHLERARDDMTLSLGRQPTVGELAGRLEAREEMVLQALELDGARHTIPLAAPRGDGAGDADEVPGTVDDGYARADDRAVLAPLLATLSDQEAMIVFLRFSEDLTQDAIARRVGVSQMHVSRVLYRSLIRLRDAAA
jgi:RNA polymerase sigma-B factor